jgi:hypothetical protein
MHGIATLNAKNSFSEHFPGYIPQGGQYIDIITLLLFIILKILRKILIYLLI